MSLFADFSRYTFELVQEIECLTNKKKEKMDISYVITSCVQALIPLGICVWSLHTLRFPRSREKTPRRGGELIVKG